MGGGQNSASGAEWNRLYVRAVYKSRSRVLYLSGDAVEFVRGVLGENYRGGTLVAELALWVADEIEVVGRGGNLSAGERLDVMNLVSEMRFGGAGRDVVAFVNASQGVGGVRRDARHERVHPGQFRSISFDGWRRKCGGCAGRVERGRVGRIGGASGF